MLKKEDWPKAFEGVKYLIHVASPCPLDEPSDPNEVIGPALTGIKTVLQQALESKVQKVVLTSSTTTVAFGVGNETEGFIYNEENWSPDDLEIQKRAYNVSKIKSEKLAWEVYENNKDKMKLTVIVPSIFMGPVIVNRSSPSIDFFKRFFSN